MNAAVSMTADIELSLNIILKMRFRSIHNVMCVLTVVARVHAMLKFKMKLFFIFVLHASYQSA